MKIHKKHSVNLKAKPVVKTKNALPRIYQIDQKISSGKFPNSEELAREYEVSISTISRDIEFMRDFLFAPIEYNALHRGYYYKEKTYRLPGAFITADDMQAVGMVKNLLSLYKDTPVYENARQLMECISAPLFDREQPDWAVERIAVPPAASAVIDREIWSVITEGLRKNKVIAFEYEGMWDEEFKFRKVNPYQLLFDTGVWLLYGYCRERKSIRLFSLVRMKNAQLTKESFSLPANFSYPANADGSFFGVFSGEEKTRYRITFCDDSIAWLKERKWAADQEIEEHGSSVTITFTSTQYNKVLEWVLSRGYSAEPHEPERLVQERRWHIKKMEEKIRE